VGKHIYVYEATSYYDKEKKQGRQKRKILGKLDPETNEIIPTKGNKPKNAKSSLDLGHTYFLDENAKTLSLNNLLKKHFGEDYTNILSLAYYILSENSSLHLFDQWLSGVSLDNNVKNLSSKDISIFLNKLGNLDDKRYSFFTDWVSKSKHTSGVFYDISSISSYSKEIEEVEWGYNRDKERLPQINIGMLYSKDTRLPLWYDITQGSISDVSTLNRIVKNNKSLGLKDIIYIMDKGFFSFSNLEKVLNKEKVIIPLPYTTKLSKELLLESKDIISNDDNMFLLDKNLYFFNKIDKYINKIKYTFFIIKNRVQHEYKTNDLYKRLFEIEEYFLKNNFNEIELMKDELNIIAKSDAEFFRIIEQDDKLVLQRNKDIIDETKLKFGTTILFTNIENMTHKDIITEYRSKDRIEKMFNSVKNEIDFKRLKVQSSEVMKGKLFIMFIALIIDTHILNTKNESKNKNIKKYTRKEIIRELRKIKKIKYDDDFNQITDISKKSKDIFKAFGMELPKT
jgi:transposase